MPMKNFIDTIGNATRDLPACSAVKGIIKTKINQFAANTQSVLPDHSF
jgi:hypothetical protein